MARCNNGVLLNKIGMKTLTDQTEIDIRVRRDLPDCKRMSAKNYSAISGAYTWNQFRKPVNRFECMRRGCIISGLLMMAAANETVTYHARYDAVEFSGGVITLYVYPDSAATYPITLTVNISDASTFTNADSYEVTLTEAMVTDDGFIPVVVDLSETPTDIGDGWTATSAGAYIQLSADKIVGYSSIAIFDALEDFELLDVVKVTCLTTAGGASSLEMIEEACNESRYNDKVTQIPFEMTGTKVTPNYWKLNPMAGKGENTKGFVMTGVQKTVESHTIGSTSYGRIVLADAQQDVCGMFAIQIADDCNVTDAGMTQLSIPTPVALSERQFIVVPNTDGTTDILFNSALVGTDMLISYPQEVDVEEIRVNPDMLGDTHMSIVWVKYQSDQVKIVDIFDNVFLTSFPNTITNETAEFAFTFVVARDQNGDFYREQRIYA